MSATPVALRASPRQEIGGHTGDLAQIAKSIVRTRVHFPVDCALLVGISGIDGSGKGYVTERLAAQLQDRGVKVASIGIDPWQHPQSVRLSPRDAGSHFYANAIRWADLFARLVHPLVHDRSIDIVESVIRTDVDRYYPKQYRFTDVDVVLLEGIFLFQRELAAQFDLRIWIECSFETALARAQSRSQEGLTADEVVRDYSNIYFAAQCLHFERDAPRAHAHLTFDNDGVSARGVHA
jgi:uridine kinase